MSNEKLPLVLIIEDEKNIRQSFRFYLEDNNYRVLEAENGRIGLELFEKEKPDLILLDLRMPEVDGLEVLGRVGELSNDTPVIVVSGAGGVADAVEALRLGAWDYLLKPIEDQSVLKYSIEKAMERARLLRENEAYQNKIRESEERYRSLIENAGSAIAYLDSNYKVVLVNRYAIENFRREKDMLIGKSLFDIFQKDQAALFQKRLKEIDEGKRGATFEDLIDFPNGSRWFLTNVQLLRNSDGSLLGFQCISTDITERKQAEHQIRSLTQKLLKAQENERRRFSRELHDHVAQDLSLSKITCDLLLDKETALTPEVTQMISEISNTLNTTIFTVRNLAYDLRPPGLEELGLTQAILLYCDDFSEKSGIGIEFNSTGVEKLKLNVDAQINIFRLIQEALNNIWKHADASHTTIRLVGASPNIILRIKDNGKGFDLNQRLDDAASEKRMGLSIMEERVTLLRGKMTIQSKPNEGTILSMKLPYEEEKNKSLS